MRYYWLKMQDGFLNDLRLKKLRKIAGGDTFTVIYLKMMLISLESEGVLEYKCVENTFADELALTLDEDADNVSVTVDYLIRSGLLVDIGNNEYMMPYVAENLGSETASANRVRKYRERQKALQCNTDVTPLLQDGNTDVTQRREDKRREDKSREEKIREDIYMSTDASQSDAPPSQTEPTPETKRENINYQEIIDMYNNTCISLPKVQTLNEPRRRAIRARLKVYQLSDIQRAFEKAENSNFLKGANGRDWNANFDWLMKDANIAKVLDGNYDNFENKKVPPLVSSNKGNKVAQELDESYRMMQEWATEREV